MSTTARGAMDPLTKYKHAVQEQLDSADLAVSKIVHENTVLSQQVANKEQEIKALEEQVEQLKSELKQAEEQKEATREEVVIVKDLFEHLCGVRVHKSYEDETGLWFDASQGNSHGVMDYKLGFVKNGETLDTEVVYVPLLKRRNAAELKQLQARFPSYMFDTLSFPLQSLHQFYNKLSKCLSKGNNTGAAK